ncbi:CinA family nicotinamide mononucleotide deamidase-related protein [Veronia nyctiphanis]|uniref:CinA family nicotinamide mononucleotide deamidase-related protein n=1 Tax=Veronia nyctiphanis TaxID=1278244 RepID=UPI001F330E06|nr:CinA family nicotinamide mononucleotide deamidase-related protein [Veronia nyctiphanis]
MEQAIRIAMISTGEEVLHGDIDDTNASWLSRKCFEQGFPLHRRITVGDSLDDLAVEFTRCSQVSDVVIVNGGLGPTSDDLTSQAMAAAMDTELELYADWLSVLKARFERDGREMPKSNLKQAMLPAGSELIDNPIGSACGYSAKLNDSLFFFTPGVPSEFKMMFDEQILPRLKATFPYNQAREVKRLYTFGLSEASLNDSFEDVTLPDSFEIGYRSALPFIEIKLFAPRGAEQIPDVLDELRAKLSEHVVGDGLPMIVNLGNLLTQQAITVALAEQFTGGWLANMLNSDMECQRQLIQGWTLSENARVMMQNNIHLQQQSLWLPQQGKTQVHQRPCHVAS